MFVLVTYASRSDLRIRKRFSRGRVVSAHLPQLLRYRLAEIFASLEIGTRTLGFGCFEGSREELDIYSLRTTPQHVHFILALNVPYPCLSGYCSPLFFLGGGTEFLKGLNGVSVTKEFRNECYVLRRLHEDSEHSI